MDVTADRLEEMTAVGGCNGIHLVPARHVDDYYRAHAYVAGVASLLLLLLASLGALAF